LVKNEVVRVGPKITRTAVTLGAAQLFPFSGSGCLIGLTIGNPEGFTRSSALSAGRISVNVDRKSLLSDPVIVNQITVTAPLVSLEGTLTGNNLGVLMGNIRKYDPSSDQKSVPQHGKKRTFLVKKVLISGIRLNISASALRQNIGQTIPLDDIELHDIGSDGSGISAAEVSSMIMVRLINGALREGVRFIAKQGIQQIQQESVNGLNKAIQSVSDLFK
jgi:hypothetical protein